MVTIFNRKELITAHSNKEKSLMCEKLEKENIQYSIKTINKKTSADTTSIFRPKGDAANEKLSFAFEYLFYVTKEDFSRAQALFDDTIQT